MPASDRLKASCHQHAMLCAISGLVLRDQAQIKITAVLVHFLYKDDLKSLTLAKGLKGPGDHMNARILQPGSKAQHKAKSRKPWFVGSSFSYTMYCYIEFRV